MNYLASNIRYLRKERGWTQEELATKVKKAKSTITCYENGIRTPDIKDLSVFCNLFHIGMDDLVGKDLSTMDSDNYADFIKVELSRYRLTDADFDNFERFINAYYKMNENQRRKLVLMIESMVE